MQEAEVKISYKGVEKLGIELGKARAQVALK